jgi:hypothetical protein
MASLATSQNTEHLFERRLFCLDLRLRNELDADAFAAHWPSADVNFGLIVRGALYPGL